MTLSVIVRSAARETRARRARAAACGALVAGICLLGAGCSAGSSSSSSAPGALANPAGQAVAPPAAHDAAGPAVAGSGTAASSAGAAGQPTGSGARLSLPGPATQSIIYTASLTERAADLTRAATQAAQLARAAGGYVASESTALNRAHPDRSTIRMQLKIPAPAYQNTLSTLGVQLGRQLTLAQRAQDVTGTVADVASRVASAQAAITQLRALLARAGSVGDLLSVQDEINTYEANLEALQAQQRALSQQTAFSTVNLLLVATPVRHAVKSQHKAAGFLGGLAAGWHGLVRVVTALLTGAGAVLPFAVILVPAGYLAYRRYGRRLLRRPPAAGPGPAPAE